MPSSEALTDDYLAQLLAKDAKDRSIKYSRYGLQSFLPKRPTTNAPKPNTRFLKNIIKETDSHNAALRTTEVADARARLRGIDGKKDEDGQPMRFGQRRAGEDGHSSKRRRLDRGDEDERRKHSSRRSHRHRDDERHERRHTLDPKPTHPTIVDIAVSGEAAAHHLNPTGIDGEKQNIDTVPAPTHQDRIIASTATTLHCLPPPPLHPLENLPSPPDPLHPIPTPPQILTL
ncbi:MAG: hypothetical protein Q9170_001885 [Blastenia crenularia]